MLGRLSEPACKLAAEPVTVSRTNTHRRRWTLETQMIYYSRSQSPRAVFPLVPSSPPPSPPCAVFSSLRCVWLSATARTVPRQAPLSMGFSRQEHWSGLPYPSPGDLPNPGIKPTSRTLQEDSLPSEPPRKPRNTGVGSLSCLQRIFPV